VHRRASDSPVRGWALLPRSGERTRPLPFLAFTQDADSISCRRCPCPAAAAHPQRLHCEHVRARRRQHGRATADHRSRPLLPGLHLSTKRRDLPVRRRPQEPRPDHTAPRRSSGFDRFRKGGSSPSRPGCPMAIISTATDRPARPVPGLRRAQLRPARLGTDTASCLGSRMARKHQRRERTIHHPKSGRAQRRVTSRRLCRPLRRIWQRRRNSNQLTRFEAEARAHSSGSSNAPAMGLVITAGTALDRVTGA
jgi:hypothetical protein